MLEGKAKAWGLSGIDISVDLFVFDKTNQLRGSVINLRCENILDFAVQIECVRKIVLHQLSEIFRLNDLNCRPESQ